MTLLNTVGTYLVAPRLRPGFPKFSLRMLQGHFEVVWSCPDAALKIPPGPGTSFEAQRKIILN
mgnify:CR=1 FL=1